MSQVISESRAQPGRVWGDCRAETRMAALGIETPRAAGGPGLRAGRGRVTSSASESAQLDGPHSRP